MNMYGGGKNTNLNGLTFEKQTSFLIQINDLLNENHDEKTNYFSFQHKGKEYIYFQKHGIFQFLKIYKINYLDYWTKKLLPDEVIFDVSNNTIYIFEKKYQSGSGSVDEKLQTCDFKLKKYIKIFHNILRFKVNYIFILNDWFKQDKYKEDLEYITGSNCSYYFNEFNLENIF